VSCASAHAFAVVHAYRVFSCANEYAAAAALGASAHAVAVVHASIEGTLVPMRMPLICVCVHVGVCNPHFQFQR
jgi:hypothetical protein